MASEVWLREEMSAETEGPASCLGLFPPSTSSDGAPLLALGTRSGVLKVYKLGATGPVAVGQSRGHGLLSTLSFGDLFRNRQPVIVAVTAEGSLLAYRLIQEGASLELVPVFRQMMLSNIQASFIQDVDGDGNSELVVGLTDRILRSYRYSRPDQRSEGHLLALNKWELPGQFVGLAVRAGGVGTAAEVLVSQARARLVRILLRQPHREEESPEQGDGGVRSVVKDVEYHVHAELPIDTRSVHLFVPPNCHQVFLFHSLVTDIVLMGEGRKQRDTIRLAEPAVGVKIARLSESLSLLVTASQSGNLGFYSTQPGGPRWRASIGPEAGICKLAVLVCGGRLKLAVLSVFGLLRLLSLELNQFGV